MMTVQPSLVEVANLHRKHYNIEYNKNRMVEMEEIPGLLNLAGSVYDELGGLSPKRCIKIRYPALFCLRGEDRSSVHPEIRISGR